MSIEKHPLHTRLPELQKSEEVERAVARQERLTGERIPNDPAARINAYLDRLERIVNPPQLGGHEDFDRKERNIEMLTRSLYENFITKPENVPESYFELQKRIARERGQEVPEITSEMRKRMIETIIEDQKASLDRWVHYLASDDAMYPAWYKYFVFRNVLKLSQFDKELGKFKTRTESTVAPFPDIYYEPLAKICDIYEAARKQKPDDPEMKRALEQRFPTLYAELIQKSLEEQVENREIVEGEWVRYRHGNSADAETLFKTLRGKGTGWCTAGESTARAQIDSGDFHVFYSKNKQGEAVQPRIAIRIEADRIAEVRGVLPHQELEPIMAETLENKLSEFGPEAGAYTKKSADMKRLTEIEQKTQESQQLSREDLMFLYEIESPIRGFGYGRDPRIEEILSRRNQAEDMLIVFDCDRSQIAFGPEAITPETVAYIGPWSPEVFRKLPPTANYLYESFPRQKIFRKRIEGDPRIKNAGDAEQAIREKGFSITPFARSLLLKTEFTRSGESYDLVRFSVGSLGFSDLVSLREVYARAHELGFAVVPAEAGVYFSTQARDPSVGDLHIAMEPIIGIRGRSYVWNIRPGKLDTINFDLDTEVSPASELVFRIREPAPSEA